MSLPSAWGMIFEPKSLHVIHFVASPTELNVTIGKDLIEGSYYTGPGRTPWKDLADEPVDEGMVETIERVILEHKILKDIAHHYGVFTPIYD